MRKLAQRPRHPNLDQAWEDHKKLIVWWANKLKKWTSSLNQASQQDRDSIVSYLFLKLNNDLWLWDPKRGVKFSTYFSVHIPQHYALHYLRFESDAGMAAWVARSTKSTKMFKCKVINESVLIGRRDVNRDTKEPSTGYYDIESKDRRDYYSWVYDVIGEMGGKEEAWKKLTMNMDKKNVRILHRRFVLGEALKQVGKFFGLSKERIRQVEFAALCKMSRRFNADKALKTITKEHGLKTRHTYPPY